MVHVCDTGRCLDDKGECRKQFPKDWQTETIANKDGYPLYRQQNDGRGVYFKNKKHTNQYVVPYNPFLLLTFDAHINVEVCASIQSVKYLFKYIHKGHDKADVHIVVETADSVHAVDEIAEYLSCCYVSAMEAAWCILSCGMHGHSPTVVHLDLHLENQ
jgi:hypothetical protein